MVTMTLHPDEMRTPEHKERPTIKERAVRLLGETGLLLQADKTIDGVQIHEGRDVHGYYDIPRDSLGGADPLVLHLRTEVGLCDDSEMVFSTSLLDKARLVELRKELGSHSFGNEHDALVAAFLPALQMSGHIPWDPVVLKDLINQGIAEL